MDFIQRLVHYFAVVRRQMRRHRRLVVTCAAVVVFATTYALVLPAITLDEDTANNEPGIELATASDEQAEAENDGEAAEATATEGTATAAEPAAEQDTTPAEADASTTETAEPAQSAEAASATDETPTANTAAATDAPSTEEKSLITEPTTLTAQKTTDVSVTADVTADAKLPEGTQLSAREITSDDADYQKYYDAALAQLKAQSSDPDSLELQSIRLFDISFTDPAAEGDQEVEPAADVKVNLDYDNPATLAESANVNVVHIDDNDNATVVEDDKTEVQAQDDQLSSVTFQSDSFSVYAISQTTDISKTKEYRRTYTFQNDDGSAYTFNLESNPTGGSNTTTSQQIVKNGDQLKSVGTPTAKLEAHKGKEFLGWGVVTGTGDSATVDTSNLITLPTTVSGIGSADESVTLRAVFSDAVELTFYDSDNTTVIYKVKVAKDSTVDLSTYHATAEIPASGTQMVKSFVGWNTTQNSDTAMANSYTASADATFYPVYKEGYWIYFNANDSDQDSTKATFTESVFAERAQTSESTKPTNPTRAGYTFDGWYTDADCTQTFNWGATLTGNKTLYAKWTPATTNYTVVFWLQDANDGNYSYAGEVTKQGTSAQTTSYSVSMADLNSVDALKDITSYIEQVTTGDNALQQQFIKGDGSTKLNVYYNRKTYTLRFYYAYINGNNYGVDIETSPFSNATQGMADSSALSAQTAHQSVNNGLPTLDSQYTTKGTTNAGSYTYYYFDISAKYGQEISSIWPNQPFGNYSTGVTSGGSTLHFVSWATRNGSGYYSSHSNKNIKGPYSTLDSSLIIDPNQTVAQSFLAYWNYPTAYNYQVYYSLLNGENADYTNNGVGYKLHGEYSIGSTAIWSGQNNLTFEGVDAVSSTPVAHSGQNSSNKGGNVTFVYQRHLHSITFNTTTGTQIAKDENIPYGEDISKTNVVDQHTTDAQNAAPEHYTFVGWTTDPNGEGDLFQFTGTMPDNDLVLYAKYSANNHTVTFNPNGGTIPGQRANTNMSLKVLDQGTIDNATQSNVLQTTYTDANGTVYTLVGWYKVNSEGTETLFNFADKITEDITLKAHWRQSGQYYVRYVDNDTSSTLLQTDTIAYADQSDVMVLGWPSDKTVKDGYVFAGWTYNGKTYNPGETFTLDASKASEVSGSTDSKKYITLTASYTQLGTTYIAYDANGGSGTLSKPGGISNNQQVNIPLNQTTTLYDGTGFSREGYVLAGWNTKADGTGTTWQLGDKVGINDDKAEASGGLSDGGNKLYAIWAPIQKLKKVDNGTGNNQKTLSGAKFKLTKNNGSDTYVNVTANDFFSKDVKVGNDGYMVTSTDSTVDLGALKAGSYKLTETTAPAGYIVATSDVTFTVSDKGIVTFTNTDNASYDSTSFIFTVKNTAGKALPNTGGAGTAPYILGGSALMTLAIVGFALRRRNEGRGV